jgi:hypothetical protein
LGYVVEALKPLQQQPYKFYRIGSYPLCDQNRQIRVISLLMSLNLKKSYAPQTELWGVRP